MIKETFVETSEIYRRWEEFQDYLFLALEVAVSSDFAVVSMELTRALVDLTLETFKNWKEVFDEGFMLLSALCAWA